LAAAISSESWLETEFIKGTNKIFDLIRDGDVIFFSKCKADRFPQDEEILEMLRK